ncbi:MAG: urease accessory protein UreD [Acetobacteraceae bacterium]|nr:urease accessory protein UreD [Acetobacteraceae bacterium]
MNAAALPQPSHQRSRGRLELDYHLHGGRTVLGGLYQSPPMRALFPDPEADEAPICALVNTAGGLAGGDKVEIALSLGAGARASFSTPAAEKIYRSLGPVTEISVTLEAALAISGKPSAPCGATSTSQRPASMGMKDCEENWCRSMVVDAKGTDFGKARVKERLGAAPPRRFSSILSM